MIKRIIIAAALVVTSVLGFANVATADNCPTNAPCGASMPTVPVMSNPLAGSTTTTSATTTTPTTTQAVPTTTIQQSSTTGTPTISVPTVPVTAGTVQVPTIDVPTIKAPSAVTGTTGSTAQNAPVIQVPKMTWGDEGSNSTPTPQPVDPSPVYPKVAAPEKSGSTSGSKSTASSGKNGYVVNVDPTYAFPEPTDNGGLPFGSLLLVGVGALAAVSYRAAKERGTVLLGNRPANREKAAS